MRLIDVDELQSKVADKLHLVFVNEEDCYLKNNKTEMHYGLLATEISDIIEDMPTVEQKHGHWIWDNDEEVWKCSNCALGDDFLINKYCKECGAKMDEESMR